MKYIIYILCFLSSSVLAGMEVADTMYFERIPTGQDISIPNITHINHDKDGNLWVATLDGIYRFDGYEITKYISNENENHGLVKNEVYKTHLSSDGTLWIAGAYSIYKYDPSSERIIRMSEKERKNDVGLYGIGFFDIEDIDNKFMLLGSKAGLRIYDKEQKDVVVADSLVQDYKEDRYSTNAHVLQIERDPVQPHLLWLLTKSGIFSFDCITKKSQLEFYDEDVNFESLKERGYSMVPTGDYIYLLVNYLHLFKYEILTKKCTRIKQNFNKRTGRHMRNLLPHEDGFLIVYIGHGMHHYSLKENSIEPIGMFYEDGSICKSLSFVGVDHNGRYSLISNVNEIVKSKEKIIPIDYPQKIFTKNLIVEGYTINDTFKENQIHPLESYERNLQFEIGLTNRNNNDQEKYFYRNDEAEDWEELNSNLVVLEGLSAGKHSVYCKIVSNDKSFESLVKRFEISPFFYETTWFVLLVILSLIGVASIISYLVNIRKKDKKEYQEKTLELEMNALRSQMNPHFLFNSINSIKSYVISKDKDEAAEYLTQFAKLIRMILENSRMKYLTLEKEVEMLRLYIVLEQKRLNNSFDFEITLGSDVDSNFLIAPMLIQPYIENAIWHGLMNKYGDRKLTLEITNNNYGVLCKVIDNGIGRKTSGNLQKENTTSKKSLGSKITEDRIDIIRKIYKINASCEIIDLHDDNGEGIGTEVRILLPTIKDVSTI